MAFYNRVRFKPSGAPGTGAITAGAAETAFRTPAGASIPNSTALELLAEDGAAWEIFESVYTTSGTSCSRGTLIASSSGSRLSLSATAIISVIASARQIVDRNGSAWLPNANDGAALGSGSVGFSDLFLASGGVINWNNGNATLTHSAGLLALAASYQVTSTATNFPGGYNANLKLSGAFPAVWFNDTSSNNGYYIGQDGGTLTIAPETAGVGGSPTITMASDGSVVVGAPTGGAKGAGTINAVGVYDDNVLLTDIVQEYAETGRVDLEKWDAMVPDWVEPARVERAPVEVEVEETVDQMVRVEGGYEIRATTRVVRKQVVDLLPVWDAAGNGVDAVEEPQFQDIAIPEKVTVRRHAAARLFKDMIDGGFNPRDPKAFIEKVQRDRALPGMPTEAEWQHGKFSVGELHNRMCLATEIMVQAFIGLAGEVAALKARK